MKILMKQYYVMSISTALQPKNHKCLEIEQLFCPGIAKILVMKSSSYKRKSSDLKEFYCDKRKCFLYIVQLRYESIEKYFFHSVVLFKPFHSKTLI